MFPFVLKFCPPLFYLAYDLWQNHTKSFNEKKQNKSFPKKELFSNNPLCLSKNFETARNV